MKVKENGSTNQRQNKIENDMVTNFLLILWWLTAYECGCYSTYSTYCTDVIFYEETVSTKWNHEQHDETMSMEGTTIQR